MEIDVLLIVLVDCACDVVAQPFGQRAAELVCRLFDVFFAIYFFSHDQQVS